MIINSTVTDSTTARQKVNWQTGTSKANGLN